MSVEIGAATIIIIVVITVVIFFLISKNTHGNNSKLGSSSSSSTQTISKDDVEGDFFYIHNHLLKKVRVKAKLGGTSITVFDISPQSKKGLNEKSAAQLFTNIFNRRPTIQVYILKNGLTPDHPDDEHEFGEYEFDTPSNTMIKEFHIGMITSRWVSTHGTQEVTPGANAVQGKDRIYIHNKSPITLRLNYNIIIPPKDTLIYYGRDYLGVRLGTVFKNIDGYFDDFIYKIPATDIYYGVTSDIEQPNFGGFSIDEKLIDYPNEPQFLLEEKFMGGPSFTRVDPNFLPLDGPDINPIDRWGRFLDKNKIKDWIHFNNNNERPIEETSQTLTIA